MTNGLSFSYVLAWLRKTPNGKATRAFWEPKGSYIYVKDDKILAHHPKMSSDMPWAGDSSQLLAMDWRVFS